MKEDITESVETFYRNFSKTYHRMRERHKQQLQHVKGNKKAVSKKTSASAKDFVVGSY